MGLQELVPCQTVSDKVDLVGFRDMLGLVVDRIVSPEDGVVDHTHVARTAREHVMLTRNIEFSNPSPTKARRTPTFLDTKTGVGIKVRGVSAHGFFDDV